MILSNGYTLMHEHITIDLSSLKKDKDCVLDCYEETVKELKKLYQLGVRNIVDVTNIGMGRNIQYVTKMEEDTGIKILQSTGFYKEPFLPEAVYQKSEDELALLMKKEIEQGMDNSGIKAAMIGEIGTSKNSMEPMEQKIFEAAIKVALDTKKPIYTHTTLGTYALEQAELLTNRGIHPKKIVIGHIDLSGDLQYIIKVLKTGVFAGFDTIGKNNYFPDTERVRFLVELETLNLLDQIVLSMDLTRKSHLQYSGGLGYAYLFEHFLPMLRAAGMKEESIRKMLIHNPNVIFS